MLKAPHIFDLETSGMKQKHRICLGGIRQKLYFCVEGANCFIWGDDIYEGSVDEIVANALNLYQTYEALYCIFKELLMEFFNEGHERNYPQKRLGLLTAYYRVGIRSVIDEKNGTGSHLSDLNEILKESSEREKKQFIENCSLLQTPPLVEDFRELCTNLN